MYWLAKLHRLAGLYDNFMPFRDYEFGYRSGFKVGIRVKIT
jgi:hypothetical protein